MKTIYLAGGCFWGMQKFLDQFDGVLHTEVGYANGPDAAPRYEDVCSDSGHAETVRIDYDPERITLTRDAAPRYEDVCSDSGHAETVRIDYDPERITLTRLLEYYFLVIDPLSVNRQGGDRGIQYRTGIYYTDQADLPEIESVYRSQEQKAGAKLAVELMPLTNFFSAEEYHQKYLDKNPGGYCHIPTSFFTIGRGEKQTGA